MTTINFRQILTITVVSFLLFGLIGAVSYLIDQETLTNLLSSVSPNDPRHLLFTLLVLSLLLAIGLPRQIAAFSMGFWLGTTNGMLVATLAACGGCIITYLTARFFLHEQIKRRFPAQQQSLSSFFASNTLQKALIIRLLPIGSNFITNLVAGAVSAPAWQYHIGTCIGFLPQMALFAMLGAGIRVGETDQILLSVALILVAGGLSYRLYRQSRKRLPVQAS